MNDDQYQQFLRFLYGYRYLLGISLFLATVNAIASFINSLTAIHTSISSIYSWLRKRFYSKKRLISDSLSLANEIEIFFKHRDLTKPYYDPTDLKNSLILSGQYSGETLKEFDIKFGDRVAFLRRKFLKYEITIDILDKFLNSPTENNIQDKFIRMLTSMEMLLKSQKDVKSQNK